MTGQVAGIDFPNRVGLWHCACSELDIVTRCAATVTKGAGGGGSPLRIDMDDVMRMSERMLGGLASQR